MFNKGDQVSWKQEGRTATGQVEELWGSAVLVRKNDGTYCAPSTFGMRIATPADLEKSQK